jgi:HK97 family phage prohead protease
VLVCSAPFEIKEARIDSSGEFEGHGAVFGNVDLGLDIIEPGAFQRSLVDHKSNDSRPAMFWSHDSHEPIGTWLAVAEDRIGLKVRGKLTLGVPRADAAYALMKDDALGLSIGYRVAEGGASYDNDGIRHLKDVDLYEISPVGLPMNRRARITAVKGQIKDIRGYETAVREVLGFSVREARKLASGGWKALQERPTDELDELLAEIKAAALRLGAKRNGTSRGQGSPL